MADRASFGLNGGVAGSSAVSVNPVFDSGDGMELGIRRRTDTGSDNLAVAMTPQYVAPERLLRKDLTFVELLASDVYTFGKQAARELLLCSQNPFGGAWQVPLPITAFKNICNDNIAASCLFIDDDQQACWCGSFTRRPSRTLGSRRTM